MRPKGLAMTRRWVGPVEDPFWRRKLSDGDYEVFEIGYVEAMNSMVDAMEAIREAIEWMEEDGCDCGTPGPYDPPCALCQCKEALAAYEAGLEPVQYKHTVHQDCEAKQEEQDV